MRPAAANLFSLPEPLPSAESTEILLLRPGLRVERIVSTGQSSPPGFWYEQSEGEWVALLQGSATLGWEDGSETELSSGDWEWIPAGRKHRVARTSQDPPCIWLALFVPADAAGLSTGRPDVP